MLAHGGWEVMLAQDGHEALALAEREPPALVLLDLAMPGLDGWATARRFKADERLAAIPIIAVTGHVTTDEIERALDCGCEGFLAKPFDYERLLEMVRAHLG
jgi:CheY-like chemotaxis protein